MTELPNWYTPIKGITSYESILEIYDTLNEWRWPDALGEKPEGWDEMTNDEKMPIISPLTKCIRTWAGEKALLRYHHTHNLKATDLQFEDWWDYHHVQRPLNELLEKQGEQKVFYEQCGNDCQKNFEHLKNTLLILIGLLLGHILFPLLGLPFPG